MRVLLLYSLQRSGHHVASVAIRQAIHEHDPTTEIAQVDAFQYTNPLLAQIIKRTYLSVVKRRPELWEYLYDNPDVLRRVRRMRAFIHRHNSSKLRTLLQELRPDIVVCTQAFPCGMVADYKNTHDPSLQLIGVLTDYMPHSYWLFNEVDQYVVPSLEAHERMVASGVSADRLRLYGIPVRLDFDAPALPALSPLSDPPLLLVMGGSMGLGPLREIVTMLDRLQHTMRIHVVTGKNRSLRRWIQRTYRTFQHRVSSEGYVAHMSDLMRRATLLITKPGGLTTAEALAMGLPMLIVNPIPGQEAHNADYLLQHRVALRARTAGEVALLTDELLHQPSMLTHMRRQAHSIGRPRAARDIARLVCTTANSSWHPTQPIASGNDSR